MMIFKLSFPTLRHASMVKISQVMLNKELRPFWKLWRESCDKYGGGPSHYGLKAQKLVKLLPIIRELRSELSDVVRGMFRKWCWFLKLIYHPKLEELELVFHVSGKLDEVTIWRRFFDGQLKDSKSLDDLLQILQFALPRFLWYGIDITISRILSLLFPNADVWRGIPNLDVIEGQYAIVYDFGPSFSSFSAATHDASGLRRFRKTLRKLFRNTVITEQGFSFPVDLSHMDFEMFSCYMKHPSVDPSEQDYFMRKVLKGKFKSHEIDFLVDVLISFDNDSLRRFYGVLLNIRSDPCLLFKLLCWMTYWPYTQFLVPMMKVAAPSLNVSKYCLLFERLVSHLPDRGCYGVLYWKVMLNFWRALPERTKRELKTYEPKDEESSFKQILKELGKKSISLQQMIVQELWSDT